MLSKQVNMDVLVYIGLFVAILFAILYLVSTWKFNFWKKKEVPYAKPLPLFGNYAEYLLMKKYPGKIAQELCRQFPNEPYFGAFYGTEPALVVKDPEMLKLVFTKDFYYFSGRENSKFMQAEVMTKSLFFSYGDEWKVVRQNLTPLFTGAKVKNMFYLIQNCTKSLQEMAEYETRISEVVEARRLMARYSMDCVSTCAFGVNANTMGKDKNNPFQKMAIEIFKPTLWHGLKVAFRLLWPRVFYALGLKWFAVMISDFFDQLLKGVFAARDYKPSGRNDFVDLILGFKEESHIVGDSLGNDKTSDNKVYIKVNDELLVSQCMLFFAAAFETSSTVLSFTLYELAKDQDVQRRVHEEIEEYLRRQDGKIEYNCVTELPYLDACVQETTRLYPALGILTREVTEDYTFPTGLQVEKGLRIHIPTFSIHRNPEYFPEPEKYKPERFLPGASNEIKPYTFLPFGEGPRTCIGLRFAKMQILAGLATLLKKYQVELAKGMPRTLELEPKVYPTQAKGDVRLKIIKRE